MRFVARLLFSLLCLLAASPAAHAQPPRLILQITVDQLRGSALDRYRDRFGEGGFAMLMERGHVFADAVHAHSNTETIVGHATIATGADPAVHGMIGNVWFDRGSGVLHYNIEDARYPVVGNDAGAAPKDLARRIASTTGRSPRAMLARTFADSLAAAHGDRAKIFAVSLKDRGAVPMAGFSGKAMWFSTNTGEFISSTFYYQQLPAWAREWNEEHPADDYDGKEWTLLHDRDTYVYGTADDTPWEIAPTGFGRTFPHPRSKQAQAEAFYSLLTASPAGDELLADFARTLVRSEDIGQDDVPDYLSVSFSSNDYVGHTFGPESLEAEDELLRLDRTLAGFLEFIDEKVGLERTLVVLSADHGAPEPPAQAAARGIPASPVTMTSLAQLPGVRDLEKRYRLRKPLIRAGWPPYVYLDRTAIIEAGLDPAKVTREVADVLRKAPGIAAVVPTVDLVSPRAPKTGLTESMRRNYHQQRSGDLHVVADPNFLLIDNEELVKKVAVVHGSPWRYDAWVPMVFCGAGVAAGRTEERVHTTDIAVTLAELVGVREPSRATGRSLAGAVRR